MGRLFLCSPLQHNHHLLRFPASAPRVGLCGAPTPLQPLRGLEAALGREGLWIKRDDLSNPDYGGNKVRKLDFILARVLRSQARAIAVMGPLGSHWVLAAALHGRKLGLRVGAVQFHVPCNPHLERNQKRIDELLDWKITVPSPLLVPLGLAALWKKCAGCGYYGRRLALLPPGGSSVTGSLGYIEAALEIEHQRKERGLPPFGRVYCAMGTGGTACGLAAGFAAAGAPTRVVGVRVVPPTVVGKLAVWWLQRALKRVLCSFHGAAAIAGRPTGNARGPTTKSAEPLEIPLEVEDKYLGKGYALSGVGEERASALVKETEGIDLDPVYTAKAMRAFLDRAADPRARNETLLFIMTLGRLPKTLRNGAYP